MSELEKQTRQADPIASLHRMSTTAGVGAHDYVAINTLAIVSAVLGFTTALAFMGVFFLVVAAAAIVFGFVALRQIRNSNGTQSGRAFAYLGMGLALGISTVVLVNGYRQMRAEAADARQVNAAVNQMGAMLVAGDYAGAYNLLDNAFKSQWTLEQFQAFWKRRQDDPQAGWGPMLKMRGNELVQFSTLADGSAFASTKVIAEFPRAPEPYRMAVVLKKGSEGQWRPVGLEPFENRKGAPRK